MIEEGNAYDTLIYIHQLFNEYFIFIHTSLHCVNQLEVVLL